MERGAGGQQLGGGRGPAVVLLCGEDEVQGSRRCHGHKEGNKSLRPQGRIGRGAWGRSRGLWGEAVDGSTGLEATVGHDAEGHHRGSGIQIGT